MSTINKRAKEKLSLADKLDPVSNAAGTVTTTGIDLSKGKQVMYEIQIGALPGTLDANLQSAALANFQTPHNVTNSNITQLTSSNANTRVTLEVNADQVQQQNAGDRYVRLRVVIGTGNTVLGATGWLLEGGQQPLNTVADLNTVLQRLVVNT